MFDQRLHLSASQLSTFSRCGLLYKLEKIDKLPSPPSAALVKGNVVHAVLEAWEEHDREIDVEATYHEEWREELGRVLDRHPDLSTWSYSYRTKGAESDLRLREADGLWEVQSYITLAEAEAHLWKIYRLENGARAVELPFSIDFGDFVVPGKIDALQEWSDGRITVVDYKSGSRKDEAYRQLGTYRLALQECYHIEAPQWGRYFYTKKNIKTGLMTGASEWIDLSRYTKDYLYEQYSMLKRARENNVYLAAPSRDKCGMCSMKPHCTEMKDR